MNGGHWIGDGKDLRAGRRALTFMKSFSMSLADHLLSSSIAQTLLVLAIVGTARVQACESDIQTQYGDARASGGDFSELLGVACGGDCYQEVSQWSTAAVAYGDKEVESPQGCRQLCQENEFCQVWTFENERGRCELKRSLAQAPSMGQDSAEGVTSGARECGKGPFLPFPEPFALDGPELQDEESDDCFAAGGVYGGGEGACAAPELLEIHAPASVFAADRINEWWPADVKRVEREDPAWTDGLALKQCQKLCDDRVECGGWTMEQQTCFLRGVARTFSKPNGCSPAIGRARGEVITFAGLKQGCVSEGDVAREPTTSDDAYQGSSLPSWYDECETARCSGPDFGDASWAGETLRPEGCFYDVLGMEEIRTGLRGRWLVLNGGSNAILSAITFGNAIDPERFGPYPSAGNLRTGHVYILDVVWGADGSVLHYESVHWAEIGINREWAEQGRWGEETRAALDAQLGKAPYEEGATRMSLLVGQYWENSLQVLKTVEEGPEVLASGWGSQPVVFYAQVSQWYLVCGVYNIEFCNRREIYDIGLEATKALFEAELDSLLQYAAGPCGTARYDCFVATNCYDPGQTDFVGQFNSIWRSKRSLFAEVNFIDFFELGRSKPEEVSEAHASPLIHMWTLQIMLNSMAINPSESPPTSGCPQAMDAGPGCLMSTTFWNPCTKYAREEGLESTWECANARQCSIQVPEQLSEADKRLAPPTIPINLDSWCPNAAAAAVEAELAQHSSQSSASAERLWEATSGAAWGVCAAAMALLGVLVAYNLWTRHHKAPRDTAPGQADAPVPAAIYGGNFGVDEASGDAAEAESVAQLPNSAADLVMYQTSAASSGNDPSAPEASGDALGMFGQHEPATKEEQAANAGARSDGGTWEGHTAAEANGVIVREDEAEAVVDVEALAQAVAVGEELSNGDGGHRSVGRAGGAEDRGREQRPEERGKAEANGSGGEQKGVEAKRGGKDYITGLGMGRLLASLHIVVGHLHAKGAVDDVYLFGWGFTWVPWFFMLSGYVNTHARQHSSAPDKVDAPLLFLAKRSAAIFPVYALGLVIAAILRMAQGSKLPPWWILGSQGLLAQAFLPWLTERGLQVHCWFLSCMVLYWLVFPSLYRWLRRLSLSAVTVGLALCCLPPWLLAIVPAASGGSIEEDWFAAHRTGSYGSSLDLWVITLKFSPLCYFHVFLSGALLARWRYLVKTRDGGAGLLGWPCRCGATLGYLGVLLVFGAEAIRPSAAKLSARLSILMPLQALILLGLSPLPPSAATAHDDYRANASQHSKMEQGAASASGTRRDERPGLPPSDAETFLTSSPLLLARDPVARLFGLAPEALGDVSYCQYVLQFVAFTVWPLHDLRGAGDLVCFLLFLLSVSALLSQSFLPWSRDLWMQHAKSKFLLAVPLALTLFLVICGAAYKGDASSSVSLPPPFVVVEEGNALDVALNWTAQIVEDSDDVRVINPSLLFLSDGEVVRAARAHAVRWERREAEWEGKRVTEEIKFWESSVLIGRQGSSRRRATVADWDSWDAARWNLDAGGEKMGVAHVMRDGAGANGWDQLCEPRPTYVAENNTLLRVSMSGPEDPKLVPNPPGSAYGAFSMVFSSFPPEAHRPGCKWTGDAVKQMYVSSHAAGLAAGESVPAARLECGWKRLDEKNWIAFNYQGQQHYVYSLHPHTVAIARAADGACQSRYSTSEFSGMSDLADLLGGPQRLHGSGTAVEYDGNFLALFHAVSSDRKYVTMAYKFEARPPFRITAISRPLPLQGDGAAFASSLSLPHGVSGSKVVIGYGVQDAQARALVLSREKLEELFDWCER